MEMQPATKPDYLRAIALVLGEEAIKGYDAESLSRLEPIAITRLLSDNGYRQAIEAMAEYARTFSVVMPQYEPLAAWLASYAWGYGHHICIALWGNDACKILTMMSRHAATLRHADRSPDIPTTLTLYRGQISGAPLGWSWTLDKEWGANFLKEWKRSGKVLQLVTDAGNILAVIYDHADTDGHDEYVIDPVLTCQHFPQYEPLDVAKARAMIDEDFPAYCSPTRQNS